MKNEIKLKKCAICGNVVRPSNGAKLICCGQEMTEIIPNTVDCAVEKHIPNYEVVEDELYVTVNHVMEKDHFIEWIALVSDNKEIVVKLFPEQNAEARFPYIKGASLYAYCNKHGLWKKDVE